MMIEDFGPKVASVWNDLRSTTRNLMERAWRSAASGSAVPVARSLQYDPRADYELSRLLAALDARANEAERPTADEPSHRARRLADACATVLAPPTQSAEVFAQLVPRAPDLTSFSRVDATAGLAPER